VHIFEYARFAPRLQTPWVPRQQPQYRANPQGLVRAVICDTPTIEPTTVCEQALHHPVRPRCNFQATSFAHIHACGTLPGWSGTPPGSA
jgi:hypothetical protein